MKPYGWGGKDSRGYDVGDTWASDNAFLLGVDLHVYTDKMGTRLRYPPWD